MGRAHSVITSILKWCYMLILDDIQRLSRYSHWKRSLYFMVAGSLLTALIFGWVVFLAMWDVALVGALLFIVSLVYLGRKRFLSPSSVWVQSNLLRLAQWSERLQKRNNRRFLKIALEKYHLSVAIAGLVFAGVGMMLSMSVYQMFSLNFGLSADIARTLWIVHATATGFSFVVLIFFWEYLGDEYDSNSHIRIAVRYTWTLHIVYFLLAANISIGLAAILAQTSAATPLVLVQAVFYLLSIVGIYWIYRIVYKMMTQEMLSGKMFSELSHSIRRNLLQSKKSLWMRVLEQQTGREFPRYPLPQISGSQQRFSAQDIGIQGRVTDIHLDRLHDLFDEAASYGISIERLPEFGESYVASDEVLVVNGSPTQSQSKSLKEGLKQAVKVI